MARRDDRLSRRATAPSGLARANESAALPLPSVALEPLGRQRAGEARRPLPRGPRAEGRTELEPNSRASCKQQQLRRGSQRATAVKQARGTPKGARDRAVAQMADGGATGFRKPAQMGDGAPNARQMGDRKATRRRREGDKHKMTFPPLRGTWPVPPGAPQLALFVELLLRLRAFVLLLLLTGLLLLYEALALLLQY